MHQKPVSFCSMVTPTGPQPCTGTDPGALPSPAPKQQESDLCGVGGALGTPRHSCPQRQAFPLYLFSSWWAGEMGSCQWLGGFSTARVLDAFPEGFLLHSTRRAAAGGSCTGCCSRLATGVVALHWPEAMQQHLCRGMMSRIIRADKTILNEHF